MKIMMFLKCNASTKSSLEMEKQVGDFVTFWNGTVYDNKRELLVLCDIMQIMNDVVCVCVCLLSRDIRMQDCLQCLGSIWNILAKKLEREIRHIAWCEWQIVSVFVWTAKTMQRLLPNGKLKREIIIIHHQVYAFAKLSSS